MQLPVCVGELCLILSSYHITQVDMALILDIALFGFTAAQYQNVISVAHFFLHFPVHFLQAPRRSLLNVLFSFFSKLSYSHRFSKLPL